MEKTKTAKFYIPNSGTPFQLTKFEALELSDAIADQDSLLDTEDNFVKIGLSDGNKRNLLYKNLIEQVRIDNFENDQIYDKYWQHLNINELKNTKDLILIPKQNIFLKEIDHNCKNLIVMKFQDGWSIKSLSWAFGLSGVIIRKIINEDRRVKLNLMKIQADNKMPYKLTSTYISRAKEYLADNWTTKVTLQSLKNHLNNWEDLEKLSMAGVYFLLKKILKFSYKKAHKWPK